MVTNRLDQLIRQRRDRNEENRLDTLQKVQQWLDRYGAEWDSASLYL